MASHKKDVSRFMFPSYRTSVATQVVTTFAEGPRLHVSVADQAAEEGNLGREEKKTASYLNYDRLHKFGFSNLEILVVLYWLKLIRIVIR